MGNLTQKQHFKKMIIFIGFEGKTSKEELHTSIYHCVSCDLRNLSQFEHALKVGISVVLFSLDMYVSIALI